MNISPILILGGFGVCMFGFIPPGAIMILVGVLFYSQEQSWSNTMAAGGGGKYAGCSGCLSIFIIGMVGLLLLAAASGGDIEILGEIAKELDK